MVAALIADGFRNYLRDGENLSPKTRLLDRANVLPLTAPDMMVLIGGMRALNANSGKPNTASSPAGPRR